MNVYDVYRNGCWIRQIAEWDQKSADLWVRNYLPGARAVFSYTLR